MERELVLNRIRTPDGTILISRHRHDYVTYTDDNGLEYMVDGGTDYLRRTIQYEAPYKELSLYTDDPFEEIRKHYCRGGRGKDGKQPLKWIPIAEMSDEHLEATIQYNLERNMESSTSTMLYVKEQDYRKEHSISIPD